MQNYLKSQGATGAGSIHKPAFALRASRSASTTCSGVIFAIRASFNDPADESPCEATDLNIRTVQKIEAGQTNILITTAARIQKALACDWDKLMRV